MSTQKSSVYAANWRVELPVLVGRVVVLREISAHDCDAVLDLLSLPDAGRFRIDAPPSAFAVRHLIERAVRDRIAGIGFTFTVRFTATNDCVGLFQVRQLEPSFDTAFWDCTLARHVRGTGVFWEAAHLVASFAFASAGVRRLEARVDVGNARAAAALRKIGAVQEGILRRSMQRGRECVDQALWAVLKDSWDYEAVPPTIVVH